MTAPDSLSRLDLLSKHQTVHSQDLRVDQHPVGGVLPHFRFPFLYPLLPPLNGPQCLTDSIPCKIELIPKINSTRECEQGACSRPIREGDMLSVFSHQRPLLQPIVSLSMGFFFSLFALCVVLLVATFSNCHFELLFPILTA